MEHHLTGTERILLSQRPALSENIAPGQGELLVGIGAEREGRGSCAEQKALD